MKTVKILLAPLTVVVALMGFPVPPGSFMIGLKWRYEGLRNAAGAFIFFDHLRTTSVLPGSRTT